jgi:radical SAM superfamily enzyme YgiQ (UPF0313 family)
MNKKILLLSFSLQKKAELGWKNYSYNPSLGIASLCGWLKFNGYDAHAVDMGFSSFTFVGIVHEINKLNPILVGLSLYTENYKSGLSFAGALKEEFPLLKIVIGGSHPSLCPEDVISSNAVDFVSTFEGECTLLELAEAISSNERIIAYSQIDGLLYKQNGKIKKNKLRRKISDLDLLPIPQREVFDISKYKSLVALSTSRGCPAKCIYCSATTLSGATYRFRNVKSVILEMVLLRYLRKESDVRFILVDDTFTAEVSRIREFSKIIEQYNLKAVWSCESRIDVMTEELLEKLVKSNCVQIQYGIESGSQDVLNKISKSISLEKAKDIIRLTYEKGLKLCLSFMIGHYCDTKETMEDTFEFIIECYEKYHADIFVSFNTPFPKTWQHTHAKELGLRFLTEDHSHYTLGEPIVETDNFNIHDLMNFMHKITPYTGFSRRWQFNREAVKINV